jgi:hypothetical protein
MKIFCFSLASLASLAPLVLPALDPDGQPATPNSCCAADAAVQALAGSWYALDESGQPGETVTAEYRVTAGGKAVLETLFPGQPHEMITLYYEQDGALMLTHYCVLGNHPRMKARVDAEKGETVYSCVGGENFTSCSESDHMHEGRVTLEGPDRMHTRWTQLSGGVPSEVVELTLVRRGR